VVDDRDYVCSTRDSAFVNLGKLIKSMLENSPQRRPNGCKELLQLTEVNWEDADDMSSQAPVSLEYEPFFEAEHYLQPQLVLPNLRRTLP